MGKFTSETAAEAGRKSKRGENKLTAEIKNKIAEVIKKQTADNLEKDLNAMTEKERWNTIIGLSEFAIPKLARGEMSHTVERDTIVLNIKTKEDKEIIERSLK